MLLLNLKILLMNKKHR